jgi:hypothetical protein
VTLYPPVFFVAFPVERIILPFRLSYPGGMNIKSLPFPVSGRLLLLVTPASTLEALFEMVAHMALQGSLYVLDGGNAFQGYMLSRALRRQVVDITPALKRVFLARVFTCYQMQTLLSEGDFSDRPVLVLDFLSTFYDQGVRVADRRRLLRESLGRLNQLSRRVPVAVWVRQRSVVPEEALSFLSLVRGSAGQVWMPEPRPAAPVQQLSLI